jgi:catechol 2,3-dioxygenase-like lactoylglutathione lyase family enzyme
MSEQIKLSKIGVIMLGTSDMDASVVFCRDVLGLEHTGAHGPFSFFNGGGVTLALSPELTTPLGGKASVEVVFSVEHVKEAYEQLKGRGVEFRTEPRGVAGPMWATDFLDPDGHTLSIFGPE